MKEKEKRSKKRKEEKEKSTRIIMNEFFGGRLLVEQE